MSLKKARAWSLKALPEGRALLNDLHATEPGACFSSRDTKTSCQLKSQALSAPLTISDSQGQKDKPQGMPVRNAGAQACWIRAALEQDPGHFPSTLRFARLAGGWAGRHSPDPRHTPALSGPKPSYPPAGRPKEAGTTDSHLRHVRALLAVTAGRQGHRPRDHQSQGQSRAKQ